VLTVPVLVGRRVRLEPLSESHVPGLAAAGSHDRGTYGFTGVPHGLEATQSYVADLLASAARAEAVPFVQVAVDGAVVGATRYLDLRHLPGAPLPYAVEIGGTWLSAPAQRTGLNAEAKLLLLRHAFEVLAVQRVDFRTDARNERSRAALAAPGARFEGVLRSAQPSRVPGEEGLLRDTALFSVVAGEWPAVCARLTARLR
jgi:RimJ/RimL family protein N-acetyltransferase